MDRLTKEQRSRNMKAVKSSNSEIENILRNSLWTKGYRYRKNFKKIFGKPDIVFLKLKIAVFCDSEFWHGKDWKNKKEKIKSNKDFWIKKIEGNIKRDREVNKILQKEGWIVLRFWGKDIKKNTKKCVFKIEKTIKKRETDAIFSKRKPS